MTYAKYPLKNTYDFSPKKYKIQNESCLIGIEAQVWTEWIRTFDKVQFMAHPRMEALAETAWTPDCEKDFKDFLGRYEGYKSVYASLGINFAADEICMPKNRIKRSYIVRRFFSGNPDYEYNKNNKLKETKK